MHWVKWCGILMLLFCGVTGGVLLARFELLRARQARGFCELVRHIRAQIERFGTPCPQILARLDTDLRLRCVLPQHTGDLGELLAETLLLVPDEIAALLRSFATELGSTYLAEQLRCCDYYLAKLTPLCEALWAESARRVRLSFLLPIALAGALALLLI